MKNKKAQESLLTLIVTTLIILIILFLFLAISFITHPFSKKTEIITNDISETKNAYLILNSIIFSQLNENEKKDFNVNYFYELIYLYLIENQEKKQKIEGIIRNKLDFLKDYIFVIYFYDGEKYEELLNLEKLSISRKIERGLLLIPSAIVEYGLEKKYRAKIILPYNEEKLILILLIIIK
ncbi:MAG: hypothetical protein QXO12_02520 [Candidatus Pacearchaeota archaeon]